MIKPRIDAICNGCPYEKMEIGRGDMNTDFYICIHFPSCVRTKGIIEKIEREKREEENEE